MGAPTTKVLHHVLYHMPSKRCMVVARIKRWLESHAFWAGDAYSSWMLPDYLTVDGINGACMVLGCRKPQ